MNPEEPDILLVDKPKGISSFDVIRRLRRRFGRVKMGHAGTLDPRASGLMLIGVGAGTKKLHGLIGLSKVYVAAILLGRKTSTGDAEGKVIEEKEVTFLDVTHVRQMVEDMVGRHELPVPAYSAIKLGGVPLYKKARRGEDVVVPIKPMEIKSIHVLDIQQKEKEAIATVEMEVSSGTYIRSIAEEIGRRLNIPASLVELRRTKIGQYRIEDAFRIE